MMRFLGRVRKSFRYGEKGFTLIELLIVVAILGILAAVIVPNVAKFMQSGQKAAAQSELAEVQTAVYAMMADNGIGSIGGGTVTSTGDLTPAIGGFLQGGIARLKGSWTVIADGSISAGLFPATGSHWTYTAPSDWVWAP